MLVREKTKYDAAAVDAHDGSTSRWELICGCAIRIRTHLSHPAQDDQRLAELGSEQTHQL